MYLLGHVVEGMSAFERVVSNYQQSGYKNTGSLQGGLVMAGNAAARSYPKLDRIKRCTMDHQHQHRARSRRLGAVAITPSPQAIPQRQAESQVPMSLPSVARVPRGMSAAGLHIYRC